MDALDPVIEAQEAQKLQASDPTTTVVEADNSTSPDTPVAPAIVDADPDVLPLGDEILMPTPVDQIMPEPAPDGPDLVEITQEQLMADAAAFARATSPVDGLLPVDNDGVIPDDAMEFAIGKP